MEGMYDHVDQNSFPPFSFMGRAQPQGGQSTGAGGGPDGLTHLLANQSRPVYT